MGPMSPPNLLIFYRIDGSDMIECGRVELTNDEAQKLADKRVSDIMADWELMERFNAAQPPERWANAVRFRNLTVQMTRP